MTLIQNAVATAVTTFTAWGIYTYLAYDARWWWKRRSRSSLEVCHQPNWENELIRGTVAPGWERVRDEFLQNFRCRGELGAAVCIYHRGEKVVDLWGGYRDREKRSKWKKDTMVPIMSTGKGVSAFAILMQESRKKLDVDEKVSAYWPEFAQNGKGDVTVAQLIDHSTGLAGIVPPITLQMLQHENSQHILRDHLAEAKMEWPKAGDYKGYMAVMLGFYESAIVQMTDTYTYTADSHRTGSKFKRTIGKYLHDEAFVPLQIDDEIYFGLPDDDSVPNQRIAKLDSMSGFEPLWPSGGFPDGLMYKLLLQPNSYTGRAFRNPQLSLMPSIMDYNRRDVLQTEMPASGCVANARSVATMYWAAERAINTNGRVNPLGLSPKALDRCMQPAKPSRNNGWVDAVLDIECCMGAGYNLPAPKEYRGTGRFVSVPNGFGTGGAGGSFGYCDPEAEIAYSYVMNRCGQVVVDDPRDVALRTKMYEAVQELRKKEGRELLNTSELTTPHYLTKRYMEAHPELALLV